MNKRVRNPGLPFQQRLALRCGAVFLGLSLGAAGCFGSAFSVSELGARAAGMGTAFTAVADDGSALFYNVAGIAFQPGMHMQMDNTVVVGLFRFKPSDIPLGQVVPEKGYSQSVRPKFIPLASMYATMSLSSKITLGIGMFTPFGLSANSTNFNDSDPNLTKFVGRFAGTRARLEAFWFQPTVAFKVTPTVSVGLGPAFVHTHLFIEQSLLNPGGDALEFGRTAAPTVFPGLNIEQAARVISRLLPEGRSRIAGTANSAGFAAGLLWKSTAKKTSVGLAFRSSVTSHLKGKASFAFGKGYTLEQYVGTEFLTEQFPNQDVTGSFTTPATYSFGFANSSLFGTLISFDVRVQDYQRFRSVPLNFPINEDNADVALPAEKRLTFDFRNAVALAVGLERPVNEKTTVRFGYMFDRSPVPDKSVGPYFPDADRNSFTVGGTRKAGNKQFTFFYEAMKFSRRNTNIAENNHLYTNGLYDNFAHVAGLSLRFDMSGLLMKTKR